MQTIIEGARIEVSNDHDLGEPIHDLKFTFFHELWENKRDLLDTR